MGATVKLAKFQLRRTNSTKRSFLKQHYPEIRSTPNGTFSKSITLGK
jgi:hypothetical protein